ncbi:MAG: alpha/beta fold hydrolase [Sideroxydans sp.]
MIELEPRHRSSGMNSRFAAAGLPFADYVRQTRAMLRAVRTEQDEAVIDGNAPFGLPPAGALQRGRAKPYRRGILLTHGLSDSPYHLRHLAAFFQRNGFRVMAVLLPGHGTQPGDLLDVHWQAWAQTVAYGADCLAAEVDELYLGGFSAGGALSVHHAARDARVRGLFLFSPALEITARARWANLHKLYSRFVPEAAWVNVLPDADPYKYESFCKNAAAQMHALTRTLPRDGLNLPVFAAASADDATVHAAATFKFMQRVRHPLRHLVWYAPEKTDAENVEWVGSYLPGQRILSSAHTAVVMPPEDPHYGAHGDYANCLHYFARDDARYTACMTRAEWWGEVLPQQLARGVLRRLTFNPHYAALEASLQKFIGRLP